MRTQRARLISIRSKKGLEIRPICFQPIDVVLTKINQYEYTAPLPGLIPLQYNFGTKLMTPGFENIAILNEEDYHLNKRNMIGKHIPSAKIESNELMVRIPETTIYGLNGTQAGQVMKLCMDSKQAVRMSVILNDPSDGVNYDWTTSPYPMSPEDIEDLKKEIMRKEFQLILSTKSDEVPNMKNDTLRYHDQGKVQQ